LQLGMLPNQFPEWSQSQPIDVHALMDPAREVGGDLYDFFYDGEGTFCFLVGDVSGKGAPAAMFMARARSLIRMAVTLRSTFGPRDGTPAEIMSVVNRELCLNNRDRMFVTLFLGMLDTRTGALAYSNAGHPLPHVLRASGETDRIDGKPEVPLAVRVDFEYQGRSMALQPGDAVFVCTDGVMEATSAVGERYTDERLSADLRAVCALSPERILRAVRERVDAFTGPAPKADDVAMLALRWAPTRAPSGIAGSPVA
jgi:phosphoserine phosphatase RsbU/P